MILESVQNFGGDLDPPPIGMPLRPATLVVNRLVWFIDGSRTTEGTGAGVYGKSLGRRLSTSLENMLQFFRLRCMLSWSVLMKFK